MTNATRIAHLPALLTACLTVGCLDVDGDYDFSEGEPVAEEQPDAGWDEHEGDGEPDTDEPAPEEADPDDDTGDGAVEMVACDELDTAYTCPADGQISRTGDYGFCWFPQFDLPPVDAVVPACESLEDGTLGFGWETGAMQGDYECPTGAEQTDDDTHTYCLWNDIELPPGNPPATACHKLAAGQIGFFFACDPS